ncbi:DNA invertase Pin-like site-specific DNA recombinase [Azospirillum brasilense]|nr:DNA invertase Pin-like site-specific DNA recombinase [Azospirillum brasilense]
MTANALAYLRTSSAANVEGDSAFRQNDAVMGYASRTGINVVACYWDAAVSGADPIETRDGFAAMLEQAVQDGIGLIIVEDASRFARGMIAQEMGVMLLVKRGIRVVTASGQDLTDESDPSKVMMRQIAGAFSQYEKAKLVQKLKHGREQAKAKSGKCEGRKSHAEQNPKLVKEAKRLARKSPKTGKARSLRQISEELAALGFLNVNGKPYAATSIKNMLEG